MIYNRQKLEATIEVSFCKVRRTTKFYTSIKKGCFERKCDKGKCLQSVKKPTVKLIPLTEKNLCRDKKKKKKT